MDTSQKAQLIDWDSSETHVLVNPRLPAGDHEQIIHSNLPTLSGHVWLLTSGTTARETHKLAALSKRAFLTSAEAVNAHLESTSKDRWLNVLPHFHAGGLSIFARAYLSGAKVIDPPQWRWNISRFFEILNYDRVTLTALVPAQVFDLVRSRVICPSFVRAVIVGGGRLDSDLYVEARKLGWPLLPSYGLTECCSQVATAELSSLKQSEEFPRLKRLSHVSLKINEEQRIQIQSAALLTGYLMISASKSEFIDPKRAGWFTTEDLGECHQDFLKVIGRVDEQVKVSGELVDLKNLNTTLSQVVAEVCPQHFQNVVIMAVPDARIGQEISLFLTFEVYSVLEKIRQGFHARVRPFERPRSAYVISALPRTELGKIKVQELLKRVGF